jgi:hypothetical protein
MTPIARPDQDRCDRQRARKESAMSNLNSRLEHLERQVGQRPCQAGQSIPRCIVARSEADHESVRQRVGTADARCACGQPHHVKMIMLADVAAG